MRLHRFFIEERIAPNIRLAIIDKKLLHEWRDVLRLKVGSEVILFDGFGMDHRCELATLGKDEAICMVQESSPNDIVPRQEFCLFVSLLETDRFEWLLEKATELGVSYIHPTIADRSEIKEFDLERAKDVVREAAENSGRSSLPALYEPMELQNIFKEYTYFTLMSFDLHGERFQKSGFRKEEKIGAFIGPEGGWSARELELFRQEKIPVYSLGLPTLRAETAAVSVAALLLLQS